MIIGRSCAEHWIVGGKARVRRGDMWSRLSVGGFAPVTKGSRSAWPCAEMQCDKRLGYDDDSGVPEHALTNMSNERNKQKNVRWKRLTIALEKSWLVEAQQVPCGRGSWGPRSRGVAGNATTKVDFTGSGRWHRLSPVRELSAFERLPHSGTDKSIEVQESRQSQS
jgi:hypothetical protein